MALAIVNPREGAGQRSPPCRFLEDDVDASVNGAAAPSDRRAACSYVPGVSGGLSPGQMARDPKALKNAFEALLLGELVKPLEQSLQASGLFPRGAPGEIYAHIWKTQVRDLLARRIDLIPGWQPSPELSKQVEPANVDEVPAAWAPPGEIPLPTGGMHPLGQEFMPLNPDSTTEKPDR